MAGRFTPSFVSSSCWEIRHQACARWTTAFGITIPASWQARSPRDAYCELELSPVGGPSWSLRSDVILRTTLGLRRPPEASAAAEGPPVARSALRPLVGTPICAGPVYDHCPFAHCASI